MSSPRPLDPRPGLVALRAAGICYVTQGRLRYNVGPGFSYWPSTDRWRSTGDQPVGGYGVEGLIQAIRERGLRPE